MAPKKSIFRAPDAQHFQLVHRSLRDPLVNDPEASQRVLKPVERGNDRDKGYTLADLDASIDKSKMRPNEGEAALYGITYDDSSYDYMAHLRPIQGGFDSFMIPAPRGSGVAKGMKGDRKGKSKELFVADDYLASREEVPLAEVYGREENIPRELQGLQPDMDPHLRQVLEALEDDAFIDEQAEEEAEGDGGEWWGELIAGGEADEYEREEFEFEEWGVDKGGKSDKVPELVVREDKEETWEDRFRAFKQAQRDGAAGGAGSEAAIERSEMADTLGSMVSGMEDLMVRGGKKRRGKRGPSDASGMSMSSSSMFRTQGLRDLDARFDKVERDYGLDEEEEDEEWDDTTSMAASTISGVSRASGMSGMSGLSGISSSSRRSLYSNSSAAVPEVSREDFDAILDDFLDNYEVVGRRMRPALGGTGLTGVEKLSVLRSAVEGEGEDRDANRQLVLEIERLGRGQKAPKEKKEKVKVEAEEKWDVETILSTYTNTENHPAVIGTRSAAEKRRRAEAQAQAQLRAQQAEQASASASPAGVRGATEGEDGEEEEEEDSGSETEMDEPKVTVARPKGESAEERKARKAAVKAERAARRAEKKSHTATFGEERKKQLASHKKMVAGGRAADVAVGTRGVVSLR